MWVSAGLVLLALSLSLGLYFVENERAVERVNNRSRVAAGLLINRLQQLERNVHQAARFYSLSDTTYPDRFFDFAQQWQPGLSAAEFFWIGRVDAKNASDKPSYPIRLQVGSPEPSLALGLDLGAQTWSRHLFDAKDPMASLMPTAQNKQPNKPYLLVVTPVFKAAQQQPLQALADTPAEAYLAIRLSLVNLLTPPDPELIWQVSASGTQDKAKPRTSFYMSAAPSDQLLWSAQDVPVRVMGLDWTLRIATASPALLPDHFGSAMALVLGLLLAAALALNLRARQRKMDALHATLETSKQQISQAQSLQMLAIEAHGMGTFTLNASGVLVSANASALNTFGRNESDVGSLELSHWWLGLGNQPVDAALHHLALLTQEKAAVASLVQTADKHAHDVALSLVHLSDHGAHRWAGVIVKVDGQPLVGFQGVKILAAEFEQTQSQLSIWGPDLRCLSANQACADWHGLDRKDMVGMQMDEVFGSTLLQLSQDALTQGVKHMEIRQAPQGGDEPRDLSYTFTRVFLDSNSQMVTLHIRAEDVTAQRDLARNLSQAALHDRALFARTPLGVYLCDDRGALLESNHSFCQLTGYNAQELSKLPWNVLAPADQQAIDVTAIRQLHETGHLEAYEKEFVHKSGHRVPVRVFAAKLSASADASTYGVIVEDLRAQHAQAAKRREEELRVRTAFESIDEALAIFDDQDRLYLCNKAYRDIYNTSKPVIQTGVKFEDILHYGVMHGQYPDAAGQEQAWVSKRLEEHCKTECVFEHASDNGGWLRLVHSRTPDNFAVLLVHDITEQKSLQEAGKAASDAKSDFLAMMSHEIRTPLNGILGMAQVMQAPVLADDKRLDFAQTILDSGNVLLHLLNQILDLSKIEAGKFDMVVLPCNPGAVCDQVKQLFAANAELKDLTLSSDWKDRTKRYELDQQRLTQMLSNLVGNAIKFTERGGVRIEAQEIRRDGEWATLEFNVHDTGPGLSEAQQLKLFIPFSRLFSTDSGNEGSAGLGLSIVKAMAEQMGGQAGVKSILGEGSCFFFHINVRVVDERAEQMSAQDATLTSENTEVPDSEAAAGLRVMVMEDNQVMQRLLRLQLVSIGAEVVCFDDGQAGMDALAGGDLAQVLLLDLDMPHIGGLEVAELVRDLEASNHGQARVLLAVTASAYEEDKQRCLDAGMDDMLVKPVTIQDLASMFKRLRSKVPLTVEDSVKLGPNEIDNVRRLWRKLEPQLVNQQYNAMQTFEEIYVALTGCGHDDQLRGAVGALHAFKFDVALQQLQPIIQDVLDEDSI